MEIPRRQVLQLAAGAAAIAATAVPPRVSAADYPTRPVRLIVGFPPGGAADIAARIVGQLLSERLGQQIIVENRPGAGTNIGTEAVVRAPPDGYTLLLVSVANTVNATLYEKLGYNFIRDIAPVASISRGPLVMEVHPSVPARSVAEFVAYAKANPGKMNMSSPGNGTPGHMAGEMFKMMTGASIVHVPYRGGGAGLTDLLSGQVQVAFDNLQTSLEHIKTGRVMALAVTAAVRSEMLPQLPTVGESVPGFEVSSWFGIGAPGNTPGVIIERLNREINGCLADPRLKARFADLGVAVLAGSPAAFGKLVTEETEKWAKVVKFAGIKAE
jgi:tripartite-type tricarboxylate transporter receptor subunit TctC